MRTRWEDDPSGDGSDNAQGVLMAALTVEDAFALGLRPGELPTRNPRSAAPVRLSTQIATPPDRPARRLRPSRR